MSGDDYFVVRTNQALTGIEIPDGKMHARLRYQIDFILKEVARDVRHAACDKIGELQRDVQNLRLEPPRT